MWARICPIVDQILLLPLMHFCNCFVFSKTQQITIGQIRAFISCWLLRSPRQLTEKNLFGAKNRFKKKFSRHTEEDSRSHGYGKRLMLKRWWVWIPALDISTYMVNFSHSFLVKLYLCLKRPKKDKKRRPGMAHFQKKGAQVLENECDIFCSKLGYFDILTMHLSRRFRNNTK